MTSFVIPSWRSRRERAMSSSSFFKTLPFAVHPLARSYLSRSMSAEGL
jgi:hypothetical protein